MWMGLTPIQASDWFSKTLLDVCSSTECYTINFARICLETIFIVYKFVLSCAAFNCIYEIF